MPLKPPAFQFYAKDFLSSSAVAQMSLKERGVYISLLAAAWNSEEPGSLQLPIELIAKSARLDIRSLRKFLNRFTQVPPEICKSSSKDLQTFCKPFAKCFQIIDQKLVNPELHEMWLNYKKISEIRRDAVNARYSTNVEFLYLQNRGSSSASASASVASASSDASATDKNPPLPPKGGSDLPQPLPVKKRPVNEYTEDFLKLWKVYPRKDGKFTAFKAFQNAGVNGNLQAMIDSIQAHKQTTGWQHNDGQYIPHLATYLNGKRWEDEEDEHAEDEKE